MDNSKVLIKICGVRSPEMAEQAARAGANFIVIIFHPESKRFVNIEQAKIISAAATKNGAIPVGVFVNQSAEEIQDICLRANISVIQLHGNTPRQQHHNLSNHYLRFYVQTVLPNGNINPDNDNGLIHCDPKRDYVLFDNVEPGTGKILNWNIFDYHGPFRWGLSGGLTPDNIILALKKFQPNLIDVSSGVENISGEKDLSLIKNFILVTRSIHDS